AVTSRKSGTTHHRRMRQQPLPADMPARNRRMIGPPQDSKEAVSEKEELVAAPIVPVRKLRNPYRSITIPTMRKVAPTRRTVTAPHPNGRLVVALRTGAGAYGEGAAMGRGILTVAVGFETPPISRRINVPVAFSRVRLPGTGSAQLGAAV